MNASTRRLPFAAVAVAICACALALACWGRALAAVEPGVYTADVIALYANPDDGSIADAGGSGNATLGQSMVEGVAQRSALVENDAERELVTVRLAQADMVSDVRVAADADHDGAFEAEVECERVQEDPDANTADYRFAAEDDGATFRFSVYVEPMGRDVVFFVVLGDPVPGNAAGFVQTVTDEQVAANLAAQEEAAAAATGPAASASSGEPADDGLDMTLVIGVVVAAVAVIALVAYFAAIRPGREASRKAAEEVARRGGRNRS